MDLRGCVASALFILILGCAPLANEQEERGETYYSKTVSPLEAATITQTSKPRSELYRGKELALREYADRICCGLKPFDPDRKLYYYETMDYWAHVLRTSQNTKVLKMKNSKTFPNQPYLMIYDSDQDTKPDRFAYQETKSKPSMDFGVVFDLNADSTIDYMVFNGGPMMTRDFKTQMWMNYHLIDSNQDGKIDIMVYNDIDLDGDHRPDKGVTCWIYDTNYDGGIDRAEYLGYTPIFPIGGAVWIPKKGISLQKEILLKDGSLQVKKVTGIKFFQIGAKIGFQDLLDEVNAVIQ